MSSSAVEERHISILITGYFDRGNLGDDLFKDVWAHIFNKERFKNYNNKYTLSFITVDDLEDFKPVNSLDVILIAGGDVLNYYFLAQIQQFIRRVKFRGVLCAFSVGIPYTIAIADGLIDPINYVVCRAQFDANALVNRYGSDRVAYFPDISVYLREPGFRDHNGRLSPRIKLLPWTEQPKFGVFLARTIHKSNSAYEEVVAGIARSLDTVQAKFNCCIYLLPFNTYANGSHEDDRVINRDVAALLKTTKNVVVIDESISVTEMYDIFRYSLDLAITMRYHSHMYAIVSGTPLASIAITSKVHNLLADSKLDRYSYSPPTNETGLPVLFDDVAFLHTVTTAFEERDKIRTLQETYLATSSVVAFEDNLERILLGRKQEENEHSHVVATPIPTRAFTSIRDVIRQLVVFILKDSKEAVVTDEDVDLITDEIFKGNLSFMDLLRRNRPDTYWTRSQMIKMGDFLAALACFALVQIPYPKYHFGMSKKILYDSFDARADFTWVWTDNNTSKIIEPGLKFSATRPQEPLFDATFVGIEDFKGCHRSGWQYVLDHLMSFHSPNAELILDNYLDRTFHWAHDVYEYTGIIPFPRPWCGFIHHTFNEEFSPFNVVNLFSKPTFLKSLSNCKGLFTLSHDLANKLKPLLRNAGYADIPIASFVHPTESGKLDFSVDQFLANEKRKVVMVGAWLRDNFAIYRMMPHEGVSGDPDRVTLTKAILRGRNMSNYFKPTELALSITGADQEDDRVPFRYDFSGSGVSAFTNNKFALGLIRAIDEAWQSVEEISTLHNDDYDILLSENIVFLKLVDASAVNTIIECIVRKTPVLVNRLPAVVEMLGVEYPFYYEGLTEAGAKVNHVPTIKATVAYLQRLDTTRYSMIRFIADVKQWFSTTAAA